MLAAITPQTRAIFVANPNNPTGTLATRAEVMRLINGVPANVLLVMDEAYLEFLDKPVDLVLLIRGGKKPNLLLMRTFSKIAGLAGLRLGYGIAAPELVSALEKIRQPFNINAIAQALAHLPRLTMRNTPAARAKTTGAGWRFMKLDSRNANWSICPRPGISSCARRQRPARV